MRVGGRGWPPAGTAPRRRQQSAGEGVKRHVLTGTVGGDAWTAAI